MPMAKSPLSPHSLLASLPGDECHCLVAYSGGMDSHVLLKLLCELRDSGEFKGAVRAVHVHHGINESADVWVSHCQNTCTALSVPLETIYVNVNETGKGMEDAARQARLDAFELMIQEGEYLLTAHHLDDQIETMLFRISRGTGLRGLAGIRQQRSFGKGVLFRPLLEFSREALKIYAEQEHLNWVEDGSNTDTVIDRNYLRQIVLPQLEERWPGYRKNWQRLAHLAEDGQQLQLELGLQDLAVVKEKAYRISIPALLGFSVARQRNILRSWFLYHEKTNGLPAPDFYVGERILSEVIPAAEDAMPVVSWKKGQIRVEVRRYADKIYLRIVGLDEGLEDVLQDGLADEAVDSLTWNPEKELELPWHMGKMGLIESDNEGFAFPAGSLDINFRKGGEKATPSGRKTRSLKKILQDYHVPPWLRDKVPLVYQEGVLMAVGDLFICEPWQLEKEPGNGKKIYRIQWDRPDLHCGY